MTVGATTISVPGCEGSGKVELGVRPQDATLEAGGGTLRGKVALIEMLGWEALVHVDVAGATVVVRVEGTEGSSIEVGQEVGIGLPQEHLHVFSDSGASIWCGRDHA